MTGRAYSGLDALDAEAKAFRTHCEPTDTVEPQKDGSAYVTIWIDPATHANLKAASVEHGRPVTELCEIALVEYMRNYKP